MAGIVRRRFIGAGAVLWLGAHRWAPAATPTSRFGVASTAEEVTAGLDLSGRTVVVTGCNSGIGFEAMRVLALRGAHVIGTARTRAKGEEACGKVEGRTTPLVLELTDFESVVECSRRIRELRVPIDVLMLNAGIVYEMERTRYHSPEQFYYPPGDPRMPIRPTLTGERESDRVGFTIGGGSKFYVSPNAYINAGLQITRAKPSTTVTALAGIGIEF